MRKFDCKFVNPVFVHLVLGKFVNRLIAMTSECCVRSLKIFVCGVELHCVLHWVSVWCVARSTESWLRRGRLDILTPWCRVLLEKLTGLLLVKKFPAIHGTRRFITALTSVRHLSLSWASPIQSLYTHALIYSFRYIIKD